MLNLNLMDLYNGLVRNYENLSLNKSSQYDEISNKESKFFITLGKFLGYKLEYKGSSNGDRNKKIRFKYDFKYDKDNKDIVVIRETDMSNDLDAIQKLVDEVRFNDSSVIQFLETFSENRIDYLNKILLDFTNNLSNDLLVVYIIRDILKAECYHYCYLFNSNGIKDKYIVRIKGNPEDILYADYMD